MCGICGILDPGMEVEERDRAVARMNTRLAHRGPDGEGVFGDASISLGHRRLAIIDLDTGSQPMSYRHWCVVFNGEIYNFMEVRKELSARGHRFVSRSDTEVILHAFDEWGLDSIQRLTGMFAMALWNSNEKRLYLIRDRVGIKPLYYGRLAGGGIAFSSEIDPLLQATDISRQLNKTALLDFMGYGFASGPETLFAAIQEIPPGHLAVVEPGGEVSCRAYWQLADRCSFDGSMEDAVSELDALLQKVVRDHLVSDVPVCTFLSGGIDSSGVSALAAENTDKALTAYTVSFPDSQYDETRWAKQVAQKSGLEHRIIRSGDHSLTVGDVEMIVRHVGQPFADSSCIPTYLVCREAAREFKVVLSGDGGDETFYGYETFAWLSRIEACRRIPVRLRRGALRMLNRIPATGLFNEKSRQFEKALRYSLLTPQQSIEYLNAILDPDQLEELLSVELPQGEPATNYQVAGDHKKPYRLMSAYLFHNSLPQDMLRKVDRMSMRSSLEVRVPLLDHRIAEFAASLPQDFHFRAGKKKYLLKRVLSGRLPTTVLTHKKQGFSIPLHRFYTPDFLNECETRLRDSYSFCGRLFKPDIIRQTIAANRNMNSASKRNFSVFTWSHLLWMMLQLEIWADTYHVTLN